MRNDFAVLILSHGRPDRVETLKTLHKCGYTGKWYIVIDDEDSARNQYEEIYGKDNIVVFSKSDVAPRIDTMENSGRMNAVIYARNECFNIANKLGIKYFLELDDDYCRFEYRYAQGEKLMTYLIDDFDYVVDIMIEFLEDSDALTVAFAQGGDLIGGKESPRFKMKLIRKAMNSFFCTTDRPFDFIGLMNDDVNTYCLEGSRGSLFFTVAELSLVQVPTQKSSGGLTELYEESGTYEKSFYSVMCCPSFIRISEMGCHHKRIHHLIDWEHGVPKILSESYKVK